MVPILDVEFEVLRGISETGWTGDINSSIISLDMVEEALRAYLLSTGCLVSTRF